MDPLLKKLNYKPPAAVTVLAVPLEVQPVLERWSGEAKVRRRLGKQDETFVLAFVKSRAEIAERAPQLAAALGDDAVLWMAYPKKSSKRYRSDIGRDDSWQPLGDLGFEPVRQVAIDPDWSALRFRRAEHVTTMVRDPAMALSAEGKRRAAGRAGDDDPAVREYLATLPDARRAMVEQVHRTIRRSAPELKPAMWNGTIGYGIYHYRYVTGREGEWFIIGLANQKQYVSMYVCAAVDGVYLAEANAERLGKVSVGRSCVRFKKVEDLDLDVVSDVIRQAADSVAAGNFGV